MDSPTPFSFMTALPLPFAAGVSVDQMEAGAEAAIGKLKAGAVAAGTEGKSLVKKGVNVGAQGVKTALSPVGVAGQGASDIAGTVRDGIGFLSTAVTKGAEISRNILIGELVLAGVTVLGVVAAIAISKSARPGGGVHKILFGVAKDGKGG